MVKTNYYTTPFFSMVQNEIRIMTMKFVTPMTSTNIFFKKDGDFQSIQEVLINASRVINSIVLIAQ